MGVMGTGGRQRHYRGGRLPSREVWVLVMLFTVGIGAPAALWVLSLLGLHPR